MQDKKLIIQCLMPISLELLDEAGIDPDDIIEMYAEDGKIIITKPDTTENFACDGNCKCCPVEKLRCANDRKRNVRCKKI